MSKKPAESPPGGQGDPQAPTPARQASPPRAPDPPPPPQATARVLRHWPGLSAWSTAWPVLFWGTLLAFSLALLAPAQSMPSAWFAGWDKVQHALAFAVLTVLGLLAHPERWLAVPSGLLLYGALVEWAQHLSGARHGDPWDWLADALGVLIGILILRRLKP